MTSSAAARWRASSTRDGPAGSRQATKLLRILRLRPAMTLSSVLMPLNSATFWKVRAMPSCAATRGCILRRVRPLKVMVPSVGW